jgi:hypothetical protein
MPSLRTLLMGGGFAVLALLAARNGAGHVLANPAPDTALRIDGTNGRALANKATALLMREDISETVSESAALSHRALIHDPLNPEAARNMGVEAAAREKFDLSSRWIALSSEISRRDIVTQAMIFAEASQRNDPGLTIQSADILMRQSSDSWPGVTKSLVKKIADPAFVPPLIRTLSRNPTWRGPFLSAMGSAVNPLDRARQVLEGVARSPYPPKTEEVTTYLIRLEEQADAKTMWQQWVLLGGKPYASQLLRDGELNGLNAPWPYVWRLFPKDDVVSELAPRPMGKGKALYVSYDGRKVVNFAQQKLNLAAGDYFLLFETLAEQQAGAEIAFAGIKCGLISSGHVIAKSQFKSNEEDWAKSALRFVVPAGCDGQYLWFGTEYTPRGEGASYWIDNVRIVPAHR